MTTNNQKSYSILLIEDDLFVRDLYIRTLERANYHVITALDGEEGVQKSSSTTPDLILLDIMLPKINGIDVLKKIKSQDQTKTIPVFLLTNLGQEAIIKEAFNLGAAGFFLKARLLPQEVIGFIQKFLETGIVPEEAKQI